MPVLKRRRGRTSAASSGPGYKQASQYESQRGHNEDNGNIHHDTGHSGADMRRTLVIPPPSHEVAAALHDEMDTFSFKNPALTKFKLSNELLENVINKLIPLHTIIPPESFPKVVFDGSVTDTSKLSKDELLEKIKLAKPTDVLFGDLETLKAKMELVKQSIDSIESLSKNRKDDTTDHELLDSLVGTKYKFEVEKFAALKRLFHTYNAKDLEKYEQEVDKIGDELKKEFKKQIKEEEEMIQFSQADLLKDTKVTCTFAELKEKKAEEKTKLAELERIKREEEERKAEELRKKEEGEEKKRKEELAEQQKREQEIQQQQAQQQQQQQQQQFQMSQQPIPQSSQPIQVPVGDNRYFMDPFGGPSQSTGPVQAVSQPLSFQMGGNEFGLDNGNVDGLLTGGLYGAGEDLLIDDDAGFGALDDQVFLSNLDGSLD